MSFDSSHSPGREPSLEAGWQLIQARRPEMAERELRHWLSLHPDDAEGHALLAWSLALQGRASEAVEAGEEAVGLAPDWAFPHAVLAEVNLHLDRPAEAERNIREALALNPFAASYHAALAAALLNQPGRNRGREALAAAEAGLAIDADDPDCARLRAQALLRMGRRRQAREAAAYALQVGPDVSATHVAAGWVELAAGDRARSRAHLREALRMDPANDHAARVLRLVGDGARFCAALAVLVERWAWRLALAAAVFAAELAALRARDPADAPFATAYSLFVLSALSAAVLWARFRHPALLAEARQPGALTPQEQRDARWALVLALGVLLLMPLGMLADGPPAPGNDTPRWQAPAESPQESPGRSASSV